MEHNLKELRPFKLEGKPLRLVHYSKKPIEHITSTKQDDDSNSAFEKPKGLWISVEGWDDCSWKDWCEAESFELGSFVYEIRLRPMANILVITTSSQLDQFDKQHKTKAKIFGTCIPWNKIAEIWQGIIIAPYCRQRSFSIDWYYYWDCSSGCIWDSEAILEIKLLNH